MVKWAAMRRHMDRPVPTSDRQTSTLSNGALVRASSIAATTFDAVALPTTDGVKIPDEVLVATIEAYDSRREVELRIATTEFELSYPGGVPDPNSRRRARYEAALREFMDREFTHGRDEQHPAYIPDYLVRHLVRVAKMYDSAKTHLASDEEYDKVRRLQVELLHGKTFEVEYLVKAYRLEQLLPNMVDMRRRRTVRSMVRKDDQLEV